jgi:hypothetical protein
MSVYTFKVSRRFLTIITFILLAAVVDRSGAFVGKRTSVGTTKHSSLSQPRADRRKTPNDDDDDDTSFLDKAFFYPSKVREDSPLRGFANLVENDYETAEILYAGSFFVVLLVITQELLRMQMFGDSYVPFLQGGGKGALF